MKYFLISFLLSITFDIYSQNSLPDNYILSLTEKLETSEVNIDDLDKAINRLHNFSEYIYNPVKILSIDSLSYTPANLEDEGIDIRWGTGTWGRGSFSKYVDRYLFDGFDYSAYHEFYGALINPIFEDHFWGSHPIVSYCSRIVIAYYYLYQNSDDEIVKSFCKDRFINGAKYLVTQQKPGGGFVQWHWRKDKSTPNLNDEIGLNDINSYSTATATFALKNVYDYLIRSGDKSSLLTNTIYSTIDKAGNFLANRKNSGAHKNYISFSIWGLVNAYKITKNFKFIESATAKYINDIEKYQDNNGAWYKKGSETIDYHDAHSPYMGIIIRALIDLYDILPSDTFSHVKERLRKSIIKGFNNFLYSGVVHKNFPLHSIRLANDGGIYPYLKQEEYTNFVGGALQLSQAIMFALLSDDLFTEKEDRINLKKFLASTIKFQVTQTTDNKNLLEINSDIYFHTFAMYLQLRTSQQLE